MPSTSAASRTNPLQVPYRQSLHGVLHKAGIFVPELQQADHKACPAPVICHQIPHDVVRVPAKRKIRDSLSLNQAPKALLGQDPEVVPRRIISSPRSAS